MRAHRYLTLVSLFSLLAGCNWIELISQGSDGQSAEGGESGWGAVSADARYVVFSSSAFNLVPDDNNGVWDVFVRDTVSATTTRVSVGENGVEGDDDSLNSAISGDGRYVAFYSEATNLVENDTNGDDDVFLHDLDTGATTRISVNGEGEQGLGDSSYPSISADGRFIAFESEASNLDLDDSDNNVSSDVFVHDVATGITSRVSVDSMGNEASGSSRNAAISLDGRYVAFDSDAENLVDNDDNGMLDVFVHDRQTATTTRVSIGSDGTQANGYSVNPSISGDGRFVAFDSNASNLVDGDTNFYRDIFVHDRLTGVTSRVSVDSQNNQANGSNFTSFGDALSDDGRYVTFGSYATNLIDNDTNAREEIFVHDRATGSTIRVSETALGAQVYDISIVSSLSADGRYVLFDSYSDDLMDRRFRSSRNIFLRALPQLSVNAVTPDQLPIGETTAVTITGDYFLPGTSVASAAMATNIVVVDENTITLELTVHENATPGSRNILVTLPGTGAGAFAGTAAACVDCISFF